MKQAVFNVFAWHHRRHVEMALSLKPGSKLFCGFGIFRPGIHCKVYVWENPESWEFPGASRVLITTLCCKARRPVRNHSETKGIILLPSAGLGFAPWFGRNLKGHPDPAPKPGAGNLFGPAGHLEIPPFLWAACSTVLLSLGIFSPSKIC